MTKSKITKWHKAVGERIAKNKATLLGEFRKMPVLQVALERAGGISRSSYYNWRDKDEEFCKDADEAIAEGEALITDMSEGQLISLIKDKHFPAVQLWLRKHHPKYKDEVELSGSLSIEKDEFSEEELGLLSHALKLADAATKPETAQNNGTQ